MASWFLKFIIVHDLQTRENFFFLCNNWFAVEKSDGLVNRVLPVAGEAQKTDNKYLLQKLTKQNFNDNHLWFSIFIKPVQSTYSRLERTISCFVLLYISMLVNILYYGSENDLTTDGLLIGPFLITFNQVILIKICSVNKD